MKTIYLTDKHNHAERNKKNSINYNIILGLYCIVKSETINRQLPLLHANDKRRNFVISPQTIKSRNNNLKQQLAEQFHALLAPVFKRNAA